MLLDLHFVLFKTIVAVYQLLNEEQLKRWDNLDEGYYAGELTEQVSWYLCSGNKIRKVN